ncbi:MAG: methyltransferase domain-containing protein [Acidobacteriota bacterium]|nr:methyltransferase domain-containing protein [Acidobacteriota bacterium]
MNQLGATDIRVAVRRVKDALPFAALFRGSLVTRFLNRLGSWALNAKQKMFNAGRGERPSSPTLASPTLALRWICDREAGGVSVEAGALAPRSVSGDAIGTLLDYGEGGTADVIRVRLLREQRVDGSFRASKGESSAELDTAQALRGLLHFSEDPPSRLAAERSLGYLRSRLETVLREGSGEFHFCTISTFSRAAEVLHQPDFAGLAGEALDLELDEANPRHKASAVKRTLPCELHALLQLNRPADAKSRLRSLASLQKTGGEVSAGRGRNLMLTSAMAELAICWYKTGDPENGDRVLDWMEKHQEPSGGFRSRYGRQVGTQDHSEDAEAARLYLDANRLRVVAFMDRHDEIIPASVASDDGRLLSLLKLTHSGDRIVEVGCGKGRFLKGILDAHPGTHCTGVDISTRFLRQLPPPIQPIEGSLERIPCSEGSFDFVFSVEAIEHSANISACVRELTRIAHVGGLIAIIDKQQNQWGKLICPPWERWPRAEYVKDLLERGCDDVTVEPVGYDGHPADGLMLLWTGRKR